LLAPGCERMTSGVLDAAVALDGAALQTFECEFCDVSGTFEEVEAHELVCPCRPGAEDAAGTCEPVLEPIDPNATFSDVDAPEQTPASPVNASAAEDSLESFECEYCSFKGSFGSVEAHKATSPCAPTMEQAPTFPDSSTWVDSGAEVELETEAASVLQEAARAALAAREAPSSFVRFDKEETYECEFCDFRGSFAMVEQHEATCREAMCRDGLPASWGAGGDSVLTHAGPYLADEPAGQSTEQLGEVGRGRAARSHSRDELFDKGASPVLMAAERGSSPAERRPRTPSSAEKHAHFSRESPTESAASRARRHRDTIMDRWDKDDEAVARALAHGLPTWITEPAHRRVERHWGNMSCDIDFQAAWGGPNNDRRGKVIDMHHTQEHIANLRYPYRGDADCEEAYHTACFKHGKPSAERAKEYVEERRAAWSAIEEGRAAWSATDQGQLSPRSFRKSAARLSSMGGLSSGCSAVSRDSDGAGPPPAWMASTPFIAADRYTRALQSGHAPGTLEESSPTLLREKLADFEEVEGTLGQRWLPAEGLSTDAYVEYLARHLANEAERRAAESRGERRSLEALFTAELPGGSEAFDAGADAFARNAAKLEPRLLAHDVCNLEAAWRTELRNEHLPPPPATSWVLPDSNLTPSVLYILEDHACRLHAFRLSQQLLQGHDPGASSTLQQAAATLDASPNSPEKTSLRWLPHLHGGKKAEAMLLTPEAAKERAAKVKVEEATDKSTTVSAFLASVPDKQVSGGLRAAAARQRYWAPGDRESIRQAEQPLAGGPINGPSSGGVSVSPDTPHVLSRPVLLDLLQRLRKQRMGLAEEGEDNQARASRRPSKGGGSTPRKSGGATPRPEGSFRGTTPRSEGRSEQGSFRGEGSFRAGGSRTPRSQAPAATVSFSTPRSGSSSSTPRKREKTVFGGIVADRGQRAARRQAWCTG